MDSNNSSSSVVQSQGHENNENLHHNVGSEQVAHSEEKPNETTSVMNKVRAKAKKFKVSFMKHGHNVFDQGHDHPNEDHHIPDDNDLDEDEEMDEDQEEHQAPIHESEIVRNAKPASEQVENLGKSGVSFGGTTVKGEEPHQEPRLVGVSPTTEINQNITTDPAKTFVGEEESGQPKVHLEEDPHLSGSRPEAYTPQYQTKDTDLTGAGTAEIDTTPVEKSFAGMKVQDEPKPSQEPKVLPNVAVNQSPPAGSQNQFGSDLSTAIKTQNPSAESHDQYKPELSSADKTQYPSAESHDQYKPELSSADKTQYPSAESHGQFEPDISTAVKTKYPSDGSHDQFAPETISASTNKYHEDSEAAEQTFNTATTKVEEQPNYESVKKPSSQSSYTDEISPATSAADRAVSDKHTVDSELSYGKKGDREDKVTIHDEQKKSGDASNISGSTAEHGKNTGPSLTEKLAPVYGKVAGVGSVVMSKLSGTGTGTNTAVGTETENGVKEKNKGVSVKDYLAEKLRPGEEDKALSEVISEALHKQKEEPKEDSGDEDRGVTEVISDDTNKREEEETVKEEGHGLLGIRDEESEKVSEENSVNSPGKGMVDKLKGVVGSWFTKSGENQSTQEDEGLPKSKNSDAEVKQVTKGEGDTRLQE